MRPVQLSVEDFVTDANVRGMDLHLSTYDVPRSGSSHFDPKTGVLTIEFHYMDDEPYKEKKIEDRISLRYGKHSGKVLAILIPVAKGNIGEVRLRVTNALEKIDRVLGDQISRARRFNEMQNYTGVKSILDRNRNTVVANTVSSTGISAY